MLTQFGRHSLDLDHPHVMGILNVTPDSFYDGGRYFQQETVDLNAALKHAEGMVLAGASFIDIGGESTRPGAIKIGEQQELDRVVPVVEALVCEFDVVVSVDTSSPALIQAAAKVGAGFVNDVRALQNDGALAAAESSKVPICMMHMQGQPDTMQNNPAYKQVVDDVSSFLMARVDACERAGIAASKIIIDPGFGFGKTDAHNFALLAQLSQIKALGFPVLVGLSRKSMIGRLLGRPPAERLAASLAMGLIALQNGASILRVHDVQETMDVVNIFKKITTEY
ncbi:MAG: dihydropteroate synthase [Lentisphaeria bacterium]|jgi:dihydropteroate synthase